MSRPRSPFAPAAPAARAFVLALGLSVALVAPVAVFAQDAGLTVGATAIVGNTGGDGVVLREGPGFDARVLASYPDGSIVQLTDGPIYAEDGSVWFGVIVDGAEGFMLTDYLSATGTTTSITSSDGTATGLGRGPEAGRSGVSDTSAVPGTISGTGVTTISADGVNDADNASGSQRVRQQPPAVTDDASGTDGQLTGAQLASDLIGDPTAVPAGEPASVGDLANLVAAPDPAAEVLRVLPAGSDVVITGEPASGWVPAWYNGTYGYLASDLVLSGGAAAQPVPSAPSAQPAVRSGAATVAEGAELKAAPGPGEETIGWVPAGTGVEPTAGPQQGFYEVGFEGQTGWISGAFLVFESDQRAAGIAPPAESAAPAESAESAAPAESAGSGAAAPAQFSGLAWPVDDGSWAIMQGYNGTSHINADGEWQYRYSLDLVREDAQTAGEDVFAPAPGIVRWTQSSSGGVSIDLGNGYAVALFHVTLGGHLKDGEPIDQGEWLGTISGPGGMGYAGTPHLHFTLWETGDGGNWDREAVPFSGPFALPGADLPDVGGSQQHTGLKFQP
jgi:uncharacterized protein YgiM (DUF1202 family)